MSTSSDLKAESDVERIKRHFPSPSEIQTIIDWGWGRRAPEPPRPHQSFAPLFCCSSIQPHSPQKPSTDEPKSMLFMEWAKHAEVAIKPLDAANLVDLKPDFAVELVRQANFGPLEKRRFFVPKASGDGFLDVAEDDLIEARFRKPSKNKSKNYKCSVHNKFFEVYLYQKDPVNIQ